tara:strand:- start:424 stop:738 length:315 start_codon:yes stop_codon:yes gene_type:complete
MSDALKAYQKCSDSKCKDVVSKKELKEAKNQHIDDSHKDCKKYKIGDKWVKCTLKSLSKSNYQKLLKKRSKCAEKRCAREGATFRKEITKSFKKFKKRKKTKRK